MEDIAARSDAAQQQPPGPVPHEPSIPTAVPTAVSAEVSPPAAEPDPAAPTPAAMPGGVRVLAVALAVLLTVAAGAGGLVLWAEHRVGPVAVWADGAAGSDGSDTGPAARARAAAVSPLLSARTEAVRSGRRAGWDATLDVASPVFRSRQIAGFDRIRQLPVTGWREVLLGTAPLSPTRPDTGSDAFVATVRVAYRLPGDTRDIEHEQHLTVARRSAGWVFATDTDGRTEPDLWDFGPLTVARGQRSLVVGVGRSGAVGARVREVAAVTDAAASRVDAVWGGRWRRPVVVVVPQTLSQMAAALGRPDGAGLSQVAAVTSGALGRVLTATSGAGSTPSDPTAALTGGGAADRVVVNPQAWGRLSLLGRRVVLTHELTHVATRAMTTVPPPLWVEEGFANYVAYQGSGLSPAAVASDVLPLVRAGTAPAHLPTDAEFDPARTTIAPAYADAWLAFDLMARGGAARPLAFYRASAGLAGPGGTPQQALAAAFRTVLGTDVAAFETSWRQYRATVLRTAR